MSYIKDHTKMPILKENKKAKNELRKEIGMKWDEYHELEILLVKSHKTLNNLNKIRKRINVTWKQFENIILNLFSNNPQFSDILRG